MAKRDARSKRPFKRPVGGLVYSSEDGRTCPHCARPQAACVCRQSPRGSAAPVGDGLVRIARETKGRKGKGVTVITGVPLAGSELQGLARRLKQRCGSGGTVKDGTIEIQGDHRDALMDALREEGFSVKRAGG